MHIWSTLRSSVFLFAAVGGHALISTGLEKRQSSLDQWIATESPIAKAGVLANIGPDGAKDQGAASGVVIASPSTSNPDYVYSWARDSALVFKLLVDEYISGRDTTLLPTIKNFVASQSRLQQTSNPSGGPTTGGLGEPKFNKDESPFTGAWGRPQRDGPPLRATTLITLGNYLRATESSYVSGTLWPIIRLDLDYVVNYWDQNGFDLWEEVNGMSFFTIAVSHRALREGATFATAQGDSARSTTYTTEAVQVLCYLQNFWSSSGYVISNINVNNGRTGKDANSILTSVHTFDPNAGPSAVTFQPGSDKALANHKAVVDSFRGSLYPINSGKAANAAVAVGRYSEDVYYNGNPWYLTTAAAAEQLYLALYQWNKAGKIDITATSLAFWQQLVSSAAVGSYASGTATYTTLTSAVKTYADGFLSIVQTYQGANGSLAEQFTRANGTPISASDLTWSYAAVLTAFEARSGVVPGAWGAAGLTTSCGGGSNPGNPGTVAITFNVQATTVWGENIYVVGSLNELRNWDPSNAILLSSATYPIWSGTVSLPASTYFEYKYVKKTDTTTVWASGNNWFYTSPSSGSVTLSDTWR